MFMLGGTSGDATGYWIDVTRLSDRGVVSGVAGTGTYDVSRKLSGARKSMRHAPTCSSTACS